MSDQDTTPRCPSCGVPWAEHDGPIKMCETVHSEYALVHSLSEQCMFLFKHAKRATARAAGRASSIRRLWKALRIDSGNVQWLWKHAINAARRHNRERARAAGRAATIRRLLAEVAELHATVAAMADDLARAGIVDED